MDDTTIPTPTRERIRQVAEELYVRHGHDGFSFGDIAAAIGTTRANIHHHFGTKRRLMAELLEGFAADAEARIAHHWTKPGLSFTSKMRAQCDDLRRFYDRFNSPESSRNVWSPISRLRLDLPALGSPATASLERVNRAYETSLRQALAQAIARGEFRADTAVDDVVRLLRTTLLSCGPITQDTGSFAEVEKLLASLVRTVEAAWGTGKHAASA